MTWKTLDDPNFIDRDPATITSDMVTQFEAMAGRTLYPAQPERLVVDMISYRETLTRIAIQTAAKLNLVRFSSGPILDYLGELLDVSRLAASSAKTTIRFTLAGAQNTDIVVPAGTRVQSSDGGVVFATTSAATIAAGSIYIDVVATAETAGATGNGLLPGAVATLLSTVDDIASAINSTTSYGGQAAETDERLRQRIVLAPEGFAAAGPAGAYGYWAMATDQSIVDASVLTPYPGLVAVYVLTDSGTLTSELAATVLVALSADKRRPITDQVVVRQPIAVDYTVEASLVLYAWANAATVRASAATALANLTATLRATLGGAIVPSKFVAALQDITGVQSVSLTAPSARALTLKQFAVCTATAVTLTGVVDG